MLGTFDDAMGTAFKPPLSWAAFITSDMINLFAQVWYAIALVGNVVLMLTKKVFHFQISFLFK